MRRVPETSEGRVARWATIALGGSIILPFFGVFAVLGISYHPSPEALLLCLFVAAYVGPIYFLDRIERYTTLTRKRIWVVSLVIYAPIALFAVIAAIVWSWGFLLLLVPELIGTVLLVKGVGFHVNGHTMSNIKMTL